MCHSALLALCHLPYAPCYKKEPGELFHRFSLMNGYEALTQFPISPLLNFIISFLSFYFSYFPLPTSNFLLLSFISPRSPLSPLKGKSNAPVFFFKPQSSNSYQPISSSFFQLRTSISLLLTPVTCHPSSGDSHLNTILSLSPNVS